MLREAFVEEQLERRVLLSVVVPDPKFGNNGSVQVPSSQGITLLPDGKILSIGNVILSEDDDTIFSRLLPDGAPDPTFGMSGRLNLGDVGRGAISDDRFYVDDAGLIRAYTFDGKLDSTFAQRNINDFLAPIGGVMPSDPLGSVYPMIGGGLLVRTFPSVPTQGGKFASATEIAKMNPDGTLDTSFGDSGFITINDEGYGSYENSAIVVGDKGILIPTDANNGTLRRYTLEGKLDTTFGNQGAVTNMNVLGLAEQEDGKVLIVPAVNLAGSEILRLNANGTTDTAFGNNGIAQLNDSSTFSAIALDPQQNIYVTLHGLHRLSPSGQPDAAPLDGSITTALPLSHVQAVADADGRILINYGGVLRLKELVPVSLGSNGTLTVTGSVASDTVTITNTGANKIIVSVNSYTKTLAIADVKRLMVNLGDGDNSFTMSQNLPAAVVAGAGDDTIITGPANDSILAGAGDDTVSAGEGNDTIDGGAGNDSLSGNGGLDKIHGADGDDRLAGNGGRDSLFGDAGNDRLYGGATRDYVYGNAGDDQLFGEGGDDHLNGGDGKDTLHGDAGNDEFVASDAAIDHLFGDGGHDSAEADKSDLLTSIEAMIT